MLRAIDPASVNARNPHILLCMLRLLRAGFHRLNGCSRRFDLLLAINPASIPGFSAPR
ncbi:hypothetical protein EHW99_0686 [Erwinia amylovora]|uniref:Uncharacterized protein n=2 Tax=Erwinia amylovora TaxID=552 RepID=A0A830ZVG1_ERWAM|nr:hypothetical protein [Erwinia amylovora]EKV52930.1 hypothetical protein EaACW_2942 [Erwinia amylovora ACW56400]CBA22663.1 hypothetical protein predicted by Glimmer/Critica [Erwinia amylovora CFBP1430]CCO79784.1 hypothetical protein BN432_3005 [Erwinia amylovora Ea356]CCO83587.1 hypothetical protein BN433_3030 [Erwinia amylovora Ea266]CCO87347.1 hypothetical protein BN434_2977 [Erwinia amylovora CFBP 2585]CCO91144.1 hypothetical protein BN435_2992 [Erwinia amylovora 01SFR-BO]CCO94928.1 hyp